MSNKRVLLDSDDFKKLTKGEIISKNGIEIALSDIGWDYMIEIIKKHITNSKNYKYINKETMNPIITNYVPYVVNYIINKTGLPKDEKELIEFCQELAGQIIKRVEPIRNN